jgi:hypothetical protein
VNRRFPLYRVDVPPLLSAWNDEQILAVVPRGGLPRSKKIKVLHWSGTTDFSRSSLGFLPTVSHERLTARPSNKGSRSASCSLLSRQRDVIEAAHVQPFALLERKAIGSPQSVQSVMAALEAHRHSKPCGVIP